MADGLDKAPALLAETLALVFAAGFDWSLPPVLEFGVLWSGGGGGRRINGSGLEAEGVTGAGIGESVVGGDGKKLAGGFAGDAGIEPGTSRQQS
jgi:hypothetical protein